MWPRSESPARITPSRNELSSPCHLSTPFGLSTRIHSASPKDLGARLRQVLCVTGPAPKALLRGKKCPGRLCQGRLAKLSEPQSPGPHRRRPSYSAAVTGFTTASSQARMDSAGNGSAPYARTLQAGRKQGDRRKRPARRKASDWLRTVRRQLRGGIQPEAAPRSAPPRPAGLNPIPAQRGRRPRCPRCVGARSRIRRAHPRSRGGRGDSAAYSPFLGVGRKTK